MDETETLRMELQSELNNAAAARKELEDTYGKVWTLSELRDEFDIKGFMAPFVIVVRRADGKVGSVEFQHAPRFYFNWREDE